MGGPRTCEGCTYREFYVRDGAKILFRCWHDEAPRFRQVLQAKDEWCQLHPQFGRQANAYKLPAIDPNVSMPDNAQRVWDFIRREHLAGRGMPTREMLQDVLGWKSRSGAFFRIVDHLVVRGHLVKKTLIDVRAQWHEKYEARI